MITELNHSATITLGTVAFTEITIIINGTIGTIVIVLKSAEVIPAAQAGFGFFAGHGLVLIFLVEVIESQGH